MADYNSSFTGAQIDANLAKAATALQPGELATVATTGAYSDLAGKPTLGTAAATAATAYATAAQGVLAGTAVQPGALATVATTGAYGDLTGKPTLGTAAATAAADYATAAQGTLADSATQPGDDAADLGSGAATDGYVLTADGAGGAAWEVASGGGGTPGGSNTQVQFNDGGAFGGDSGFTFDKTNNTLGLGGGTITASDPILDMAQTWNNGAVAFTALKANVTDTASAAGSLLMDLQVGGVSQFKVTKAGLIETAHITTSIGSINGTSVVVTTKDSRWLVLDSGSGIAIGSSGARFLAGSINLGAVSLGFGTSSNTNDTILARDAANTLAQRNGVNAQAFNLYNTYTDASNYERGVMKWATNVLTIGTEKLGTGTARALEFQTDGTTRMTIASGGGLTITGAFTGAGSIQMGASGVFSAAGRSGLVSPSNGIWQMSVNAGGDFNRLQLGGATSSFPAIKRSTTSLQARLADDSAFTNIQGKLTTEANAVSETITATHTITLYDAAGTAYKVPCVAA